MIGSRRLRTTLVAMSALALVATACGGDEDEPTAEQTAEQTGGTDAPEDAEGTAEGEASAEGGEQASGDSPLAGEDVTLTVGVGPGGGYDAYVRLMAPFLAEELDANVVVNNEPGAGGLVALNNLLASDADGTQIMLINGVGIAGSALAEAEGVNFELDELAYVGRVYAGSKMIGAGADSGYETWEDVEASDEPFVFGASGPGASTYVEPTVLMELLGQPYEIITGFDGSADIQTAMAAGEVDGISVDFDSLLPSVEAGDANALLVMGPSERNAELPDTPVLSDLDLTDEQQEMASALRALIEYGRTLVMHPDTDPETLDFIRTAIENVLTDEEFLAEAESQGRPIEYASPEEVEQQVSTILDAPDEFREIVKLGY